MDDRIRHSDHTREQPVDDEASAATVAARLDALTPDEVERVLRRAIELQVDADLEPDPVALDLHALGKIADELGVSRDHLREALTEEMQRLEIEEPDLFSRLVAPHRLAARGAVGGDHGTVRATLDTWMERHEGLRKRSERGAARTWEKDAGLVASARVKLRMAKGSGALRTTAGIADSVEPIDAVTQLVTVEADTSNVRRVALTLLGVGAAAGLAAGVVGAGAPGPVDNLVVGAGTAAAVGGGVVLGIRMWARRVQEALDRAVEAAANPHLLGDTDPIARGIGRVFDAWQSLRGEARRRR